MTPDCQPELARFEVSSAVSEVVSLRLPLETAWYAFGPVRWLVLVLVLVWTGWCWFF